MSTRLPACASQEDKKAGRRDGAKLMGGGERERGIGWSESACAYVQVAFVRAEEKKRKGRWHSSVLKENI